MLELQVKVGFDIDFENSVYNNRLEREITYLDGNAECNLVTTTHDGEPDTPIDLRQEKLLSTQISLLAPLAEHIKALAKQCRLRLDNKTATIKIIAQPDIPCNSTQ